MLRDPTFCLIYRHTLVLISALFNALPRRGSLHLTLCLLFLAPLRASHLSRALSLEEQNLSRFSIADHGSERGFLLPSSFVLGTPCRIIHILFCILPQSCPFSSVSPVRSVAFSPPLLGSYIFAKRSILSSWFESFRSRRHEEEVLSLSENTWYLSVYIAKWNSVRVHSIETSSTEDRLDNFHLLIKTVIWT